jgi:hypothetical protein
LEEIIKTIDEMKSRVRELFLRDDLHVFDITATERMKLTTMFEEKIDLLKKTEAWENEKELTDKTIFFMIKCWNAKVRKMIGFIFVLLLNCHSI